MTGQSQVTICILDSVELNDGRQGTVQFMGPIQGKSGNKYGITLDSAQGKNDGSFDDTKYFECEANYGIFVTQQRIVSSAPTSDNKQLPRVTLGDKINITHKHSHGILKFVGTTEFAEGLWYGAELEEPLGKNDGRHGNRRYFDAMSYYGILCQAKNVKATSSHKLKVKKKMKSGKSDDLASIKKRTNNHSGSSRSPMTAPPPPSNPAPMSPRSRANNHGTTNLMHQDIDKMGFIQLKARCGLEGLSTFGTKKQLLGRLGLHLKTKPAAHFSLNDNNNHNNNTKSSKPKPKPKSKAKTKHNNNNKGKHNKKAKNKNNDSFVEVQGQRFYENPEDDPELRDLDPENDTIYANLVIKTPTKTTEEENADEEDAEDGGQWDRSSSIIVHRTDAPANAMDDGSGYGAFQEEEEEEEEDDEEETEEDDDEETQELDSDEDIAALNASDPVPKRSRFRSRSNDFYRNGSSVSRDSDSGGKSHTLKARQKPGQIQSARSQMQLYPNAPAMIHTASSPIYGGANSPPPPQTGIQDWIMLPDPQTGKMYYANLKTKETRWEPPAGFGIKESHLNPQFNPTMEFENQGANAQNQMWQQNRPMQNQVWQSVRNINQYPQNTGTGTGGMPNNMTAGGGAGFFNRQVSAFQGAAQSTTNIHNLAQYQQNNGQQQWGGGGNTPGGFGNNQTPQWGQNGQGQQQQWQNSGQSKTGSQLRVKKIPKSFSHNRPLPKQNNKRHSAMGGVRSEPQSDISQQPKPLTNKRFSKQQPRKKSSKQNRQKSPPPPNQATQATPNPEQSRGDIDLALLAASRWKKTTDASSGKEYWYHKDTKITSWDTPLEVLKAGAGTVVNAGIDGMSDIVKPDWDQGSEEDSGSDYSTSNSYYSGSSGSSEEDSDENMDDGKTNNDGQFAQQPMQQKQPQQGFNNNNNNNGQYPPSQSQAQPQPQQQQMNGYPNQFGSGGGQRTLQQQQLPGRPMNGYNNNNNGGNHNNGGRNPGMNHVNSNRNQRNDLKNMYLKPQTQKKPQKNNFLGFGSKSSSNNNSNAHARQPARHAAKTAVALYADESSSHSNPWLTEEEAKSRIVVRDTQKRYWQIGAEQSFRLHDWAHMHFQKEKHTKGMFKNKIQNVAELLSFSDHSKLKHSLHRLNDPKLEEQSLQTWKNICSYMKIRKSSKPAEDHVEKLIRYALRGSEELRNEIFCQLCKQTTQNGRLEALNRGWKLMLICCSFFPPSDQFVDYLACYIWNNTQQLAEIGQYAIKAMHALDATMTSGARKFPPLPLEIVKLENCAPIPVDIYFINGMKCKQVLIGTQTRSRQVLDTVAQSFHFKNSAAFALYEMELNVPSIDRMKKRYIKRELMSQQEKINDLSNMPYERELADDDRLMDIIASWLKKDKSKKSSKNKNAANDPAHKNAAKKKKTRSKSSKNIKFVIRTKVYRKAFERNFSKMGHKINFLTHVYHVINDFIPIFDEIGDMSFDLAALQLQGTFGPKMSEPNFYKPGLIAYDLHWYLGQRELKKWLPGDRMDCEKRILKIRSSKFYKFTRNECWLKYAKILRGIKKYAYYFGCTWYRGVRISGTEAPANSALIAAQHSSIVSSRRDSNDFLVGINEHGICFVNPITQRIVERYQMEEILTFGYRSNAFLFVAGTLMTQSKMQIATMNGKSMNRLVRTHIDLRVRAAEAQGQNLQHIPKPEIVGR